MIPWKLVLCDKGWLECEKADPDYPLSGIRLWELPDPPEPGRIPVGTDHAHIVVKMSGERDAREDEKWRALVRSTTRCEHGRVMRTRCNSCPGGVAPDRTGERLGTTMDRRTIVIPAFEDLDDIRAWTTSANSPASDSV